MRERVCERERERERERKGVRAGEGGRKGIVVSFKYAL